MFDFAGPFADIVNNWDPLINNKCIDKHKNQILRRAYTGYELN